MYYDSHSSASGRNAAAHRLPAFVLRVCNLHLTAALLLFNSAHALAQATFTPLGNFGGTHTEAWDVSADGSVVVGSVFAGASQTSVFYWNAGQSMLRPARGFDRPAVSADGSIVVGTDVTSNGNQAFRWSPGTGDFERLGSLPGGLNTSSGFGVSADGEVIVGTSDVPTGDEAFRWTRATGIVGLGFVPSNDLESSGRDVSDDGTVVVGQSSSQAYRWTSATGMIGLGRLPNATSSAAAAVSADGAVVVGSNQYPSQPGSGGFPPTEAFRWTAAGGMVGLGDFPGGRFNSVAYDTSVDGSVVVGFGEVLPREGFPVTAAFYWTAGTGMVNLQNALIAGGVTNLDNWELSEAHAVSHDGRTIAGYGLHNGRVEAFVATIPEPSTILLAVLAAAALFGFYLRQAQRIAV